MIVDMNELGFERSVAAVRALEVELFGPHAWSENAVRQELAAPARTYLFDVDSDACNDGDTVGTVGTVGTVRGFAGYWYDGDDAEIMDVGVAKAFQRRGVASRLLARLIDSARGRGARRVLLEVAVNNNPAIALYRRFGFEPIGLRKRYYQPEGIDAHVMALDLNPRPVGFAPAGPSDTVSPISPVNPISTTRKEGTAQ